jgi:3-mercaptopyruvate sulfurtransferase SseA
MLVLLAVGAAGVAAAGRSAGEGLTPAQAQAALAAGAVALDLSGQGAVLPGAVRLDAAEWRAWAEQGDVQALSRAVSRAGLNLSARVLVVGGGDDAPARDAARRLAAVASGQVQWLAGGLPGWQAAGLPTEATPAVRLPLPQRLVAFDAAPGAATGPADAARRVSATFSLAPPAQQLAQRADAGGAR